MRKIALILIMVMVLSTCAYAGAPAENIMVDLSSDLSIVIDGSVQQFCDVNGKQVQPIMYNGTTYLPLRSIGAIMGKSVSWDGLTKTVTLKTVDGPAEAAKVITPVLARNGEAPAKLADISIYIDGQVQAFTDANGKAVYPVSYNDTTYLPLRAIGKIMGKEVAWDGATKTVTLGAKMVVQPVATSNTKATLADILKSLETAKGTADQQLTHLMMNSLKSDEVIAVSGKVGDANANMTKVVDRLDEMGTDGFTADEFSAYSDIYTATTVAINRYKEITAATEIFAVTAGASKDELETLWGDYQGEANELIYVARASVDALK